MSLKKTLCHIIYLAPMAVLLFYPFVTAYSSEYWVFISQGLKPSAWATLIVQHYLQVAALILAMIQGIKDDRSGRSVRLLAFFIAVTMIIMRLSVDDVTINKSLATLFPVALAAVLAVSVAQRKADSAPDEVQYRGLKILRNLSWILFFLNALLWSVSTLIILKSNTDPLTVGSAYSILIGLFLYWLMPTAIVQGVWRIVAFSQFCLLTAVLLTLVNIWALIETALAPTVNLLNLVGSIGLIIHFIMISFGWAVLIWALIYLVFELKKGASFKASSSLADVKPLKSLTVTVSLAALLLGGLLFYGVYAPSRKADPSLGVKPLPPSIEFSAKYLIGPVSVRVPEEIIIGRKAWDIHFTDGDRAPLIINEERFTSPEKADEEYNSASQMRYGFENSVPDDRADLSEFDGFSPALSFKYDTDKSPNQKPVEMLKMTLHLRLDDGYLSISSRLPYLPDSDSPDQPDSSPQFEDRQAIVFLKQVKDFLAAYHWTGANEGPGYITRFGWIDLDQIPPSKLSSRAVFTYVNQGEAGRSHCRFVVSVDHKSPFKMPARSNPSRVEILSVNLSRSLLFRTLLSYQEAVFRQFPQTVAGLPGLEDWSYRDTSGVFLDWVSEESDQESSRPKHQLSLRLVAGNPKGTQADQDLWFSLWNEFLKGVKFDTEFSNSIE